MGILDEMTGSASQQDDSIYFMENGAVNPNDPQNRERALMKEGYDALNAHPKWKDRYKSLVAKLESNSSIRDQRVAASTFTVMNNQEKYLEAMKRRYGEATVMNALGPLAPSIMDIVRIFYPNMIANLICEIQPISTPNSAVLTVKPRYTTTAAGVNAGDEVFRTPTHGTYASDITTQSLGTGNGAITVYTATLSPLPLRPGTVKVFNGGIEVAQDDGSGNVTGSALSAGSINYATGALSVTFATAPVVGNAVTTSSRYDYEQNVNALRGMDIGLNLIPVNAKPHPLQLTWSIAAQLAAQSQYAIDVESTVSDLAAQYIKKERDWYIVNRIAQSASRPLDGGNTTVNNGLTEVSTLDFDCQLGNATNLTRKQHFQDWGLKLNRANSYIFNKSSRGMVSFVLCGLNASDVIRAQANFVSEPLVVPIGAHKIGTLDGVVDVVLDQSLNPNIYIFGFRGMQLGDAAMIIAEWIPLFMTPTFHSPGLQGQQGILSYYDVLVNNIDYYAYGLLLNYNA